MTRGFEHGGETVDWSSHVHGPKREEHSRFKGVCYSTSLAGVNDHGATNKRSPDSLSQRPQPPLWGLLALISRHHSGNSDNRDSHAPITPQFARLTYPRDIAAHVLQDAFPPPFVCARVCHCCVMSRLDSLDSGAYRRPRSDRNSPHANSDDGVSYNHRRTSAKAEDMAQEDTQLTSQALNSDGTPRRPMNAFMIFARRRRPQVSAANQTMRTGDISKILSKEWNSMDMADKQFYLDQAKRLKETFNSKYPDYVYRRRPNNSRKKRRPDANALLDPSTVGDTGEDFPAAHDFEYQADGQDPARDLAPSRGSSHPGIGLGYGDNSGVSSPHATLSSYGYPTNEYSASHISASGPRLPHLSSINVHDHPPSEVSSLVSLHSHHYPDTPMHSHAYTSHTSQLPTSVPSTSTGGPEHITGSSYWGSVRGDHGRAIHPAWATAQPVIPPLNVGDPLRERAASSVHTKSETLSSPFFPPSHSPGTYQSSTSSSSTPTGSPENYYSSGSQLQGNSYGGRGGGGYEQATLSNSHPVAQPQSRPSRSPLYSSVDSGMAPSGPPLSGGAPYTGSSMNQWRTKIGGQ
ncbi:hypothetical protein F5148DRAFT_1215787 [Russula earlei]|uniref:Uncharacterized protein n=1 Tax=Russula earlei TaxID=71964 RepID=A0ACC0U4R5_9AGAM|nr:hypothetical protein F5148DRAFT_1215787 [Russula earlei]